MKIDINMYTAISLGMLVGFIYKYQASVHATNAFLAPWDTFWLTTCLYGRVKYFPLGNTVLNDLH